MNLLRVKLLVEPGELLPQPSNPVLHERRESATDFQTTSRTGAGVDARPTRPRPQAGTALAAHREHFAPVQDGDKVKEGTRTSGVCSRPASVQPRSAVPGEGARRWAGSPGSRAGGSTPLPDMWRMCIGAKICVLKVTRLSKCTSGSATILRRGATISSSSVLCGYRVLAATEAQGSRAS